ncbi:MAG: TonB-dependent receptor plug domain-containing protein, partial [Polaribacter sp.]
MKNLIFSIIAFFIMQLASAQQTVFGVITDKNTSKPLANTYIYITELNKGYIANEQGEFSIQIESFGNFHLQFSHLGYETFLKEIRLTKEQPIFKSAISLKSKTININEIVISSAYVNAQKNNTIKVNVIHANDIEKVGGFTIMDAITKIPGINATTTGSMVSRPVIRGLSSNRILTVIDGVRFETQQWDDEHGIGVNENGVDKIEVIKGPESLIYGPEAMGGVINFIKAKPAAIGTIKGNALVAMSTNNLGWRAFANVAGANEKLHWNVSGLGKLYSDYFINGQSFRIPNTRLLEYGLKGSVGISKKWGSTNVSYTFNQAFYGILDGKDITTGPNGEIISTDIEKEKYPFEIEAPFHTVVDH